MNDSPLDQILQSQLKQIRNEELTSMLRCFLCGNIYRFPHTLVDCSHTFCQLCLLNYIKTYKRRSPSIKCPKCHALVDANYRKSIFKDIYKQQLIDILAPQFAESDDIIIKRLEMLFPEFDLTSLANNFKYVSCRFKVKIGNTSVGKKKEEKQSEHQENKESVAYLPDKVKQKFGINFEEFSEKIKIESCFKQFLEIIRNPAKINKQDIPIQIRAKTQRDFNFVGIHDFTKNTKISVQKLQRYLEKKALIKISETQQVPPQWMNKFEDRLDIKVFLFAGNKILKGDESIGQILSQVPEKVILYSLSQ